MTYRNILKNRFERTKYYVAYQQQITGDDKAQG